MQLTSENYLNRVTANVSFVECQQKSTKYLKILDAMSIFP